jgi:hypothetical protein
MQPGGVWHTTSKMISDILRNIDLLCAAAMNPDANINRKLVPALLQVQAHAYPTRQVRYVVLWGSIPLIQVERESDTVYYAVREFDTGVDYV